MYRFLNLFFIATNFFNTQLRLWLSGLKRETFTYAERDGRALKLDLYRPPNSKDPAPVIVYAHGGGWRVGWRRLIEPAFFEQVKRGYALVSITYTFTNKASWPAQIHDMKAAIRWVRENAILLGIDPEKIVAGGASAGGHMACVAGLSGSGAFTEPSGTADVSSDVCGVLAYYPPVDLDAMLAQGTLARRRIRDLIGGTAQDKADVLRSASPLAYAHAGAPPLYILHGTHDHVVTYPHATKLEAAVRAAGGDIELITLEKYVHADYRLNSARHRPGINAFLDRVTARSGQSEIDTSPRSYEQAEQ